MKKTYFYFLIKLYLFSFTLTVQANDSLSRIEILNTVKHQAKDIQWHSLDDSSNWSYQVETFLVTANGKEQQRIQAFDPSKPYPKQWTLLQQQYLPPNKAMLHEYNSIQQSSNQEHIPEELKNIEIIDLESITLVQETDLEYIFSFTPQLPMFEAEVNENFHGRLFFNKDKQLIEMLHLKTNSSFSPKLAFTIDSYELTIRITQFENVLHVTYIESDKSGSFLFLQEFHEINKKSFSNFLKVNGQLPPQYE